MKPIALYASPECCKSHNLNLYKGYFNVAWFAHAYAPVLAGCERVFVTDETFEAVTKVPADKVDDDLAAINVLDAHGFCERWKVPADEKYRGKWGLNTSPTTGINWERLGDGFEAQVRLAAKVAKGNIDRVLMFQDPDDVYSHLPEAYALIRNCTLANVSLNINAGATLWAESAWGALESAPNDTGYGFWRTEKGFIQKLLLPSKQEIAFIAHDEEKERMSRFVYHYRTKLKADFTLTGTAGTCDHALKYLKTKDTPHWEMLTIRPKGAADGAGHGPTGGDVVIADDIIQKWTREDRAKVMAELRKHLSPKLNGNGEADEGNEGNNARVDEETHRMAYKAKPLVRVQGITHTVLFFIDHTHAQPHQADIHVLLRTCLHPAHGVLLVLNERTAVEWGEMLREWHVGDGGRK